MFSEEEMEYIHEALEYFAAREGSDWSSVEQRFHERVVDKVEGLLEG